MAENYGYGRYREEDYDEYEDYGYEAERDEAEHVEGAEDDYHRSEGYGYRDDTDGRTDESVGDDRFLTAAVDEAAHHAVDDPAVGESAAYEGINRMKDSWKGKARDRRKGPWIPPDLTGFDSPVFWPVEERQGLAPARHMATDPSNIKRDVLHRISVTLLVSCPEVARALDLEVAVVKKAVRDLQKEELVRSVSFGYLMRPTERYWVGTETVDGDWSDLDPAVLSWHSDDAIGSLLRNDIPRVESINQVAAQYARAGWQLEGLAWMDNEAVQAVGLYQWTRCVSVKSIVFFVWVSQLDSEREIWERLAAVPEALSTVTKLRTMGHLVLVGADRWAVSKAMPMAIESVKDWHMKPADVAAWTYADGWQAAKWEFMSEGEKPFRPLLYAAPVGRFVWPWPQRKLGKMTLQRIIESCPWTRRDAPTLRRTLWNLAWYNGSSMGHQIALAGETDSGVLTRKRIRTALDLGLARKAGIAGVPSLGTPDRPEALSGRGGGRSDTASAWVRKGRGSQRRGRKVSLRRTMPGGQPTGRFASCWTTGICPTRRLSGARGWASFRTGWEPGWSTRTSWWTTWGVR